MKISHLFQLNFPYRHLAAYAVFLLREEHCLPPSNGAQEQETCAEVGRGGVYFIFFSCRERGHFPLPVLFLFLAFLLLWGFFFFLFSP